MVGTVMGTLGYMSPEQARGEQATAASDIYSVGIMFQELFTDSPVHEEKETAEEFIKMTAEGESLPVEGLDPDLTTLIERMKSLAPGARSPSFDAAEVLKSFIGKPARLRRKRILINAWIVLTGLVSGMAVQTYRAAKATRRAEQEAATATSVADFLMGLFDKADPDKARGREITARELVDQGAERIEEDLADQPVVRSQLTHLLGRVYFKLHLYKSAEDLWKQTIELQKSTSGEIDEDVAASLGNLALVYMQQGRFDEAEPLFKQALTITERCLGSEHREVALLLLNLSTLHGLRGKRAEETGLAERALSIYEKGPGV